jgi:hypothetical protein
LLLLLILAGAFTLSAWKAVTAFRANQPPPQQLNVLTDDVVQSQPAGGTPESVVISILERNPLHPQRRRWPKSTAIQPTDGAEAEGPRIQLEEIRLVGTSAHGRGLGFALIEERGQPARLVRIGELIADSYRLESVEPGAAVLASGDSTHRIRIQRPW